MKTKLKQYQEYIDNGGSMSIIEWEQDGRYDASLIEAAPVMYEALIELRKMLDPYDFCYGSQVEIIDNAIAKANGKKEEGK